MKVAIKYFKFRKKGVKMKTIAFTKVKLDYGWLGNMSPFPIEYKGELYRTTEALFQCLRFIEHPEVQQEIRKQKSPMAAKMKAKKNRHLLNRGNDWNENEEDIENMRLCLELKLKYHPVLKKKLLDTGEAQIKEDCTARPRGTAKFWGAVYEDGKWVGQNVLGTLWMEMRSKLRLNTLNSEQALGRLQLIQS